MKMFMMYPIVNDVELDHSNLIPTVVQSRGHNWCYNQPYARTDTFTFILYVGYQTVKQTPYECCPSIAIH